MEVSELEIFLFGLLLLTVFFVLVTYAVLNYRRQERNASLSPYTGKPMWAGEFVPRSTIEKVMHFLYYDNHSYDNRIFSMGRAVICRETGRIFQNAYNCWGRPTVTWSFLQQRCKGTWVSWGSLTPELQSQITQLHGEKMKGFQTTRSSPTPSPRGIEEEYVYTKPGPLYVDLQSKILLGWKLVPETNLEVLIVQRPPAAVKIDRIQRKSK